MPHTVGFGGWWVGASWVQPPSPPACGWDKCCACLPTGGASFPILPPPPLGVKKKPWWGASPPSSTGLPARLPKFTLLLCPGGDCAAGLAWAMGLEGACRLTAAIVRRSVGVGDASKGRAAVHGTPPVLLKGGWGGLWGGTPLRGDPESEAPKAPKKFLTRQRPGEKFGPITWAGVTPQEMLSC